MEINTYYGGGQSYDDSIKPKRGVVYYMLETYIQQKVDKEIERLTSLIEKRIESLGVQSITEIKNLKRELLSITNRLDKKSSEIAKKKEDKSRAEKAKVWSKDDVEPFIDDMPDEDDY